MRIKHIVLLIVLLLTIGISYFAYMLFTDGCKWKPKGIPCTFGVWYDKDGKKCGGESCVGLGTGNCVKGTCELNQAN